MNFTHEAKKERLVLECRERREAWPLVMAEVAMWGRKWRWMKKLKKDSESRGKDECVHSETERQCLR